MWMERWMDRHDEVTVAFPNFANAPKIEQQCLLGCNSVRTGRLAPVYAVG